MRYTKSQFLRSTAPLRLDGNEFEGCQFDECVLVFAGTAPVSFSGCTFGRNVRWTFDGPAALTVGLLRDLWQAGGRAIVEGALSAPRPVRSGAN